MKSSGYLISYDKKDFHNIDTSNIQKDICYEIFSENDEQVEKWYDEKHNIVYNGTITSIIGSIKKLYAIIEVGKLEMIINLMDKLNHKQQRVRRIDLDKKTDYDIILEDCIIPVTIKPYLII